MKRKDTLQKLALIIAGTPPGWGTSPNHLSMGETHTGEVYQEFWVAVRSCTNLSSLEISAMGGPACDLNHGLNVNGENLHFSQATNLKSLCIHLQPSRLDTLLDGEIFYPITKLFSNCRSLENIHLSFDQLMWREDDVIEGVRDVLRTQNSLRSLTLSFGGFVDNHFRVLSMIEACTCTASWHNLASLSIDQLGEVDAVRLCHLIDHLTKAGMSLCKGDVKFSEFRCSLEEGQRGPIVGMQPNDGDADVDCLEMVDPKRDQRPQCWRYKEVLSNLMASTQEEI